MKKTHFLRHVSRREKNVNLCFFHRAQKTLYIYIYFASQQTTTRACVVVRKLPHDDQQHVLHVSKQKFRHGGKICMKDNNKTDIGFFLEMDVPTKTYQSGKRVTCRGGKPIFYEDRELKALRDKLTGLLISYAPDSPTDKAVRLVVKWLFPLVKGKQDGDYKTTKPDTDNLQKLLKDCMTDAGYWVDDAQVVSEIVEKFYSTVQGIYIRVAEV